MTDSNNSLRQVSAPLSDGHTELPIRDTSTYLVGQVDLNSFDDTKSGPGSKFTNLDKVVNAFNSADKTQRVTPDAWNLSFVQQTLYDYISVTLPDRSPDGDNYVFRFLVNPATVDVSYTTVDSQSMARNGWNFGVWGEDLIHINMSGKSGGEYFSQGLSETNRRFSQAYRNLLDFKHVFENNGYWWEGEDSDNPIARKRIKVHGDVQLRYQNFVWYGMFESFSYSQTADTPYLDTYKFSFLAWKERFGEASPWHDSVHNDVQRGHDYSNTLLKGTTLALTNSVPSSTLDALPVRAVSTSTLLLGPNPLTPVSSANFASLL